MNESRRIKFRRGLSPKFTPGYDALCGLLNPIYAPYCGVRTIAEQDYKYSLGRTQPPLGADFIVTDAQGGESAHNYRCATDWTIWETEKKPIWLMREDPRWREFGEACRAAGLRWGGDFHRPDPGHVELLIEGKWKEVGHLYLG